MTEEKTMRVSQVALMTGLRARTIQELADAGDIKCVRVGPGKHRRFQVAEIKVYCRRVGLRWRHVDV